MSPVSPDSLGDMNGQPEGTWGGGLSFPASQPLVITYVRPKVLRQRAQGSLQSAV